MSELSTATTKSDIDTDLYCEINRVIAHYKINVDVEDVISNFWNVWGIKED